MLDRPQDKLLRPTVKLIGKSEKRLWGLSLLEWQRRAYTKVGGDVVETQDADIIADIRYVLSASTLKAFINSPNTILLEDGQVIATYGLDQSSASQLIGGSLPDDFQYLNGVEARDLGTGYIKELRKTEPGYAIDTDVQPISTLMQKQFQSSYKGITDFVTKFVWPVPAYHVTRLCANLKLTPNMVTTISLFLMLAALYFFYQGQWFWGFLTGWTMTFLDTVDGKLARTTMTYSPWGNIYDHGIDLIHPPFWYIAWFVGLGGSFAYAGFDSSPLMLALIVILAGYAIDRLIEGIFIKAFGFHIHVWTKANSVMRFIIARRNPNMFIFMVGILLTFVWPKAGEWGFCAVAFWTVFCILYNLVFLFAALVSRKSVQSWLDP